MSARSQPFICAAVCTRLQAAPELCANAKVAEAFLQQHLGGVADPLRKTLLKTISLANERDKAQLLQGLAEKAEADARAERDTLLKEVEALIRSVAAAPPASASPPARDTTCPRDAPLESGEHTEPMDEDGESSDGEESPPPMHAPPQPPKEALATYPPPSPHTRCTEADL